MRRSNTESSVAMTNAPEEMIHLDLSDGVLNVQTPAGYTRNFDFPAVAVAFGGKRIEAGTSAGAPRRLDDGSWVAEFADDGYHFTVTVTPGSSDWFFKQVEITTDSELPTPDYLEVDFQKQAAESLKCRGYLCTCTDVKDVVSDEESQGVVPGCGYPLIGRDLFTGIEHPAAFNTIVSEDNGICHWQLRHYPTWQNGKIASCRAVVGLCGNPEERFFDYLDTVRLPVLKSPLVAFCTFWSDPYIGEKEYLVTEENYISLLEAFKKLELRPDIYTLDAGWQDRNSFLRAKECYGGERALMELGRKLREAGSDLSLWVSPNGPVGMSMDFLEKSGVTVGGGKSCHYTGPGYGVMLDKRLQDELIKRACELASPEYGVRHFKVDWDNECATAPEFNEKYPTRNHVREASLNLMAHINHLTREINPDICTRNGRWPSPWHLKFTTHVSLPNGGDCEYADFPALSQRDAGANHRDFMYWCVFVRDRSVFPLDVLDNHEFGHSLRNPFEESPDVWSNTCVWAIMRGSSYHQLTLMPESLEDWQADILRRTIEELRRNPASLITRHSQVFGDCPARGGIYGFRHPAENGSCVIGLRNSSPLPQEYVVPSYAPFYEQTYPVCSRLAAGEKIVFAPHEVKVLHGRMTDDYTLPESVCQLIRQPNSSYKCFMPASSRPDVLKIHQIPELRKTYFKREEKENETGFSFGVMVPWRMRKFKVLFKVNGRDCTASDIEFRTSRFSYCRESSYTAPFSELAFGIPGTGERKNPDSMAERNARYFAADIPQGGEVFFSITIKKSGVKSEDIELWVSGCEAPARHPEDGEIELPPNLIMCMPQPLGFPRSLRLL